MTVAPPITMCLKSFNVEGPFRVALETTSHDRSPLPCALVCQRDDSVLHWCPRTFVRWTLADVRLQHAHSSRRSAITDRLRRRQELNQRRLFFCLSII
jgi:hypothetical protein